LDQLAETGPPRPPTAVDVASSSSPPQAFGQQPLPQRLRRDVQAPRRQLLAGEGRAKVRVLLPIRRHNVGPQLLVQASIRGPAAQAVAERLVAFLFEPLQHPSHMPRRPLQQPRRFGLAAFAVCHGVQHLQSITLTLTHGDPVFEALHGKCPPWPDQPKRTFLTC